MAGADLFAARYPYTGEVIGSAPRLSRAEVGRALQEGVIEAMQAMTFAKPYTLPGE